MKTAGTFIFLNLFLFHANGQKNAIGIAPEFGSLTHEKWNRTISDYNTYHDTAAQKFPLLKALPGIQLIYERELAEHLYLQPFLHYHYNAVQATNSNTTLRLRTHLTGAGVALNWYPVKMFKGLKVHVLNPLFVRLGAGVSYALSSLTRADTNAYPPANKGISADNSGIFGEGGIGYDLHFGKRWVVQSFFGASYYTYFSMQNMMYFNIDPYSVANAVTGKALVIKGRIGIYYLFK